MARELVYTSAHRGLKPGTRGFCTVAHTRGMKTPMIRLLESLSAYKSPFAGRAAEYDEHPSAVSHYRGFVAGESFSILSRVGYAGRDFTHRDNKLAYHLVLDPGERPKAGPAWLARQEGVFLNRWDGAPRLLPEPKAIPEGDLTEPFAAQWEKLIGDAGWAGVLVREFTRNPSGGIYLIYEPGMDLLPLIEDVTAILPVLKRWNFTFNTLFANLPAGMNCALRCCLPDSPALKDARATAGAFKLDLTARLDEAPDNIYVRIARGEQTPPAPQSRCKRRANSNAGSSDEDPARTRKKRDFVLLKDRTRKRLRMKYDDRRREG